MAYWITYLVNVYNILSDLVVNSDQTSVHFIPITRYWTWESKGSKHIQVLKVENKRPIIMVVFLIVNGFLLPLHIVLKRTTHHCFPPSNEGEDKCMNLGWDLTFNENHSSTLETTKQFVHKILLPYLHTQICHLGL